jgi:hypothetical protein
MYRRRRKKNRSQQWSLHSSPIIAVSEVSTKIFKKIERPLGSSFKNSSQFFDEFCWIDLYSPSTLTCNPLPQVISVISKFPENRRINTKKKKYYPSWKEK